MEPGVITAIVASAAAILTALGASIVVPLLQTKKDLRKENRDDFAVVKDGMQTQINLLTHQLEELRLELKNADRRIAHLETISEKELPLPQWSKDREGHFQWASIAFGHLISEPLGKNIDDIMGRLDTDVWGPDVHSRLAEIDRKAMMSPSRQAFASGVSLGVPGVTWTIYKWPLIRGTVHVGWMGLAVPETFS